MYIKINYLLILIFPLCFSLQPLGNTGVKMEYKTKNRNKQL